MIALCFLLLISVTKARGPPPMPFTTKATAEHMNLYIMSVCQKWVAEATPFFEKRCDGRYISQQDIDETYRKSFDDDEHIFDENFETFIDGEQVHRGRDSAGFAKDTEFIMNIAKGSPLTSCGKWSCACSEWADAGGFTYGAHWVQFRYEMHIELDLAGFGGGTHVGFKRWDFDPESRKIVKDSFIHAENDKWMQHVLNVGFRTSTKAVDLAEYLGLVEDQIQGTEKRMQLVINAFYAILALLAALIGIFVCWMLRVFVNCRAKQSGYSKVAVKEDV